MDMHIYRKFLNDCQLSGTKKSERIKYPFRKIDVYAVKIYRNNAYGNGTGNISAAGDFKLSGGCIVRRGNKTYEK